MNLTKPPMRPPVTCGSEWQFSPKHSLWRHVQDFDEPQLVAGAMHFVADATVNGERILIDWGTGQFAGITEEARLFLPSGK